MKKAWLTIICGVSIIAGAVAATMKIRQYNGYK